MFEHLKEKEYFQMAAILLRHYLRPSSDNTFEEATRKAISGAAEFMRQWIERPSIESIEREFIDEYSRTNNLQP